MEKLSWLEIRRKIWHLGIGVLLVFLIHFNRLDLLRMTVILVILSIIIAVYQFYKIIIVHEIISAIERQHTSYPGFASVFFILGCTLSLWLFPQNVAIASILVLSVGDSVAPLVGQYGKHPYLHNKRKTWEGVIAGTVASIAACWYFVSPLQAVVGSTLAMLVEGLDMRIRDYQVEDNLLLPLLAGVSMALVAQLPGLF